MTTNVDLVLELGPLPAEPEADVTGVVRSAENRDGLGEQLRCKPGTPDIDRLLVKIKFDPDTGCWNWQAAKIRHGYGRFFMSGKAMAAHRVSYEMFRGKIPEGLFACHKCDNPSCVNPGHMFLGTNADNMADRDAKGRVRRGSSSGSSKLSEADVIAIRSAEGVLHRELAERFNIDKSQVSRIRSGDYWKHV